MGPFLITTCTKNYLNNAQVVRVTTEAWVEKHSFCPNCGYSLNRTKNNTPVFDFECLKCKEEFELKSKSGDTIGKKIVDGAYSKMIERINSANNPNFFFLTYDKDVFKVSNFLIIPKYFFVPNLIEKRKPLSKKLKEQDGLVAIFIFQKFLITAESIILKTIIYFQKKRFWCIFIVS